MKNNYLLTESLIGGISVYMILRKLMTDFSEWDAYKLGIIDKNGKKLKHPVSSKEREAWDILTRFCWNIKKISMKFIGKSKFAQYFTAAYLLKDSLSLFYIEKNKEKLNETLLSDITYSKQLTIQNFIKKLPQVKCVNEDMLDIEIFKYMNEVQRLLIQHPEVCELFGEDTGGLAGSVPSAPNSNTVAGIAQGPGQYMGVSKLKAIDPMKIVKKDLVKKRMLIDPYKKTKKTKKKRKKYESN